MVKSLVTSQGADVNATDERGSTPLMEAALRPRRYLPPVNCRRRECENKITTVRLR